MVKGVVNPKLLAQIRQLDIRQSEPAGLVKRLVASVLAGAVLFSLIACGRSDTAVKDLVERERSKVKREAPEASPSSSQLEEPSDRRRRGGSATAVTETSDDRAAIVATLAGRPVEFASTARYSVVTFLGDPPSPVASGDGVADFKSNQYSLSLRGRQAGGGGFDADILISGHTMYAGAPGSDPQTWEKQAFNPDEVPMMVPDIELLRGTSDWPRRTDDAEIRRKVFEAMVANIAFLGDEQLRSVPVRHFQVELNRDEAKTKLPAEVIALAGSGVSPVEIWIDAHGRIRKLQTKTRLYELWDFDGIPAPQLPARKLPQGVNRS